MYRGGREEVAGRKWTWRSGTALWTRRKSSPLLLLLTGRERAPEESLLLLKARLVLAIFPVVVNHRQVVERSRQVPVPGLQLHRRSVRRLPVSGRDEVSLLQRCVCNRRVYTRSFGRFTQQIRKSPSTKTTPIIVHSHR